MLEPRLERIIFAIVREYIRTGEPVSSNALIQRYEYELDCCSATVRNEMARLEEMGYLSQPHTSAGRIPRNKAYRLYVDRLIEKEIAPPPEATRICREYKYTELQLDELIEHTCRLLAQLTRYTSLVLGPRLRRSFLKYLRLILLNPQKIILVMLTNTGSVINNVIELNESVTPGDLEKMTEQLNERLQGIPLGNIDWEFMERLVKEFDRDVVRQIGEAARQVMRMDKGKVFLGGKRFLFEVPEFRDLNKLKLLLGLMEEERLLAEIMDKTLQSSYGVQVVIGLKNKQTEMQDCAIVMATYRVGGQPLGTLGILGPTRMPYERVIPIVNYTAESLGSKLTELWCS